MSTSFDRFLAEQLAQRGRPAWAVSPLFAQSARPGHATIDGRERLLLSTNDYLGLACDPRVIESARRALERLGAGTRAARSLAGDTDVHRALEDELADFKRSEASLVFGSGFSCNVAVIAAVTGHDDVILSDELNHASIVDGCRLSKARLRVYPHGDMAAVRRLLEESTEAAKRLIVTDGVFSMDGELAPLPDVMRLADDYDAFVMVDDAHATGVFGPMGEGSLAHYGLTSDQVIFMGTLGKALGSVGGFIAGRRDLIDHLAASARSFLFTTALPASAAAAALTSLRILRRDTEVIERLWLNTRTLHAALQDLGYRVPEVATPIIPIFFEEEEAARAVSRSLFTRDLVVQAIGPPYVAEGTSRIRVIASAAHSESDMETAVSAFRSVRRSTT